MQRTMPNPFLTNATDAQNKKGRPQKNRHQENRHARPQENRPPQENPFLTNTKRNSGSCFSEQTCIPPPPPQVSFEESFPSLSQSHPPSQSQCQTKLNFKSAITQGHPAQSHSAQSHSAQSHPAQSHPAQSHPAQSHSIQLHNQFLHPVNQLFQPCAVNPFLHPVNNHTPMNNRHNYNYNNAPDDDNDYGDDAVSASAYDSAYTKYYND